MGNEGKKAEVIELDKIRRSRTKKLPALSHEQIIAIPEVLAGKPCDEVARTAGVSVETLHKWMKNDRAFITELYNGRKEEWNNTLMTVQEIGFTSMDIILKAIHSGDVRAAMWFLEKCIINDAEKLELSSTGELPFTFAGILNCFAEGEAIRRTECTKKGPFAFLKFNGNKK